MARNIEIKARISAAQFDRVCERARRQATAASEHLVQRDTFFQVPKGRLKLREFPAADGHDPGPAELIAYERPDQTGPKLSSYLRVPCPDAALLAEALQHSLGLRGVVEKQREVVHAGQTRIHLDRVQKLGTFLELEVVLRDEQSLAEGESIAAALMEQLGIEPGQLTPGAYIDLLEAQEKG